MIKYDEPREEDGPGILTKLFPSIFPPKQKKLTEEEEAALRAVEEAKRDEFGKAKALPPPGPERLAYNDFVLEVWPSTTPLHLDCSPIAYLTITGVVAGGGRGQAYGERPQGAPEKGRAREGGGGGGAAGAEEGPHEEAACAHADRGAARPARRRPHALLPALVRCAPLLTTEPAGGAAPMAGRADARPRFFVYSASSFITITAQCHEAFL